MTSKLDKGTQTYRILKRMVDQPEVSEEVLLANFPNFPAGRFQNLLLRHNVRRLYGRWVLPDYVVRQVRTVEGGNSAPTGCIAEPRRVDLMNRPVLKWEGSEVLKREADKGRLKL